MTKDDLKVKHDELLEKMQDPEAGEAVRQAFEMTPDELAATAIKECREAVERLRRENPLSTGIDLKDPDQRREYLFKRWNGLLSRLAK